MVKMCYGHGCQSNDLLAMAKLQNLLRSVCIHGQMCLDLEQIEMVDMAKVAILEFIPKVIGTYVQMWCTGRTFLKTGKYCYQGV